MCFEIVLPRYDGDLVMKCSHATINDIDAFQPVSLQIFGLNWDLHT